MTCLLSDKSDIASASAKATKVPVLAFMIKSIVCFVGSQHFDIEFMAIPVKFPWRGWKSTELLKPWMGIFLVFDII